MIAATGFRLGARPCTRRLASAAGAAGAAATCLAAGWAPSSVGHFAGLRAPAWSQCAGPAETPAPASLVSDWGDPGQAAKLEREYAKPDVARQRAGILALLRPSPGERVLDVGCGPGYLLADVAAAVGDSGWAEGLDPSEVMCSMARGRLSAAGNVRVQAGGAELLPYADGSFDAIVFSQVLLYVRDVPGALAEATRVLRPRGRLVVCDTDWDSLVVNTGDRTRFRRLLAACISTFVHAHLPPLLPGLLRRAGVPVCEMRTLAMASTSRRADDFMSDWAFKTVPEKARKFGLPASDVEDWLQEQQRLSDEGAFFACLHRFIFLARKP